MTFSRKQKAMHWKPAGLALSVSVILAVFLRLVTHATGFSLAEFAFAFILTYSIAVGASRQMNA
jgi:hypothetical protein